MSESCDFAFPFLFKDPDKRAKSLIKKLTHSGEPDLDRDDLLELKKVCKASQDDLMIIVFKECMKCLAKEHSQVRVSTLKLIDYLFQKSHIFRERLLDQFDTFLELTLAITQKPKVQLELPPPKKYAALLQELSAKLINSWHSDYKDGYEKIRYVYKFLKEHRLVDFSQFRVQTREDLIKRQKLAEKQERILSRTIEGKLKELHELKPEVEQLIAQIESLLEILLPACDQDLATQGPLNSTFSGADSSGDISAQEHGIANLNQRIEIEFSPFVQVQRTQDNKDIVQNLKELKKQLIEGKMTKLISIERALQKRSEQFVNSLRDIIDLKNKSTNVVMKLSELEIVNEPDDNHNVQRGLMLDNADSDSDDESEFEDVNEKEDLETYIPKSMRQEYGLESIDPKEMSGSSRTTLTDLSFESACSSSSILTAPVRSCNVRLDSGKLCPRKDSIKCPFHGKIIPRDHTGTPLDEDDRLREEMAVSGKTRVPEWQDPELLREIKAATGVDLTMPKRGKSSGAQKSKLVNTKTCDLTPQQRLRKKLKKLK